jgi:hypothetical protein
MTVAIPTAIVGTRFRPEARTAVALLRQGDPVRLERERNNPHDPNAVACYVLGRLVGYIPRKANPPIAAALDAGCDVTCVVREPALIAAGGRIHAEPTVTVSWGER